jgi:hypothetical protein
MPPTERPTTENPLLTSPESPVPPVPAQTSPNGPAPELMSEEEFKRKNQRRIELIHKDLDGCLTPEDAAELQQLETEVGAWVDARFPLPPVNMELLEQIARRLGVDLDHLEDS